VKGNESKIKTGIEKVDVLSGRLNRMN